MIALDPIKCQERVEAYQADPPYFWTEVLGVKPEHIWAKMVEVALSVRDNPKTAVKAGHGVSKTYTAAQTALQFLYCHYPSTVITTAPTHNQVEEILWREIGAAFHNGKMPGFLDGTLTKTKLDLEDKWFAYGFTTRPDTVTAEATRFQGFHNEHILVIFDEAAGIDPRIWKAARHLLTSGHTRWLAIGNPTSDMGDFPACFQHGSGWNQITISVLDTPNFKLGYELIPGVSGREYEKEIRDKYGRDSNEYKIRILGEIPEYTEGTFFGSRIAQAKKDGRLEPLDYDERTLVYSFGDYGDIYTAILFVQFIQERIHIIDCFYDDTGIGAPGYAGMMKSKPWANHYAGHWSGPDLDSSHGSNRKSIATGRTVLDTFAGLGIHLEVLPPHKFNDGIQSVRNIFPKVRMDSRRCGELVQACKTYKKKKNELLSTDDKPSYFNEPIKNWTCHVVDALRHLALAYEYHITVNGQRIGYPKAISTQSQFAQSQDPYGGHNVLDFGRKPRRRQELFNRTYTGER